MLGFILGAACVVFAARAFRRRRAFCGSHFGYGMGCGPGMGYGHGHDEFGGFQGPWNGRGRGRDFGGGPWGMARGPRWLLRGLFERLGTTPGQEKAILEAIEEVRSNRKDLRDEAGASRADIARILEGGLVDDAALEETFARQDRALARMRVSFTEALKKIAEALDERQRKELAGWIAGGGFWRGGMRRPEAWL